MDRISRTWIEGEMQFLCVVDLSLSLVEELLQKYPSDMESNPRVGPKCPREVVIYDSLGQGVDILPL